MLYMLCLAYVAGLFVLGYRCSCCYQRLLQEGRAPDRHTLLKSLGNAINWSSPVPYSMAANVSAYQRYLIHFGVCAMAALLGMYLYVVSNAYAGSTSIVTLGWRGWVLAVLVLMACIDIQTRLLPDALCFPLLMSALLMGWLFSSLISLNAWLAVFMVAAISYGAYALAHFLMGEPAVGLGDVKLYVALAACLPTTEAVFYTYLYACLACWVSQALWQSRWRPRGSCAFGPYLCVGYLVADVHMLALQ